MDVEEEQSNGRPPVATSEALSAVEDEPPLATPHGLDEIIALFGNTSEYIGEDGKLVALAA